MSWISLASRMITLPESALFAEQRLRLTLSIRFQMLARALSSPGWMAAQQFLKGWMPETWPAKHASPGSRRGREQRREERDKDRRALEACLASLMPALEAELGLKGIAWDTCCQGKAWARFRYGEYRISFHPILGLQEMDVIREVALHELLHTRYREHVPAFWQELTHLEPEWPCLEGRLRNGKLS